MQMRFDNVQLRSNRRLLKSRLPWASLVAPAFGATTALLITSVMIFAVGSDPLKAYTVLVQQSLGTNGIGEVLLLATPLLFCALGLSLAFKAKFFNIGPEGQLYMGAITSTWVGLSLVKFPMPFAFILYTTAAFAGGAGWALIPALLKVKLKVNEIITTLLMSFIAVYITNYLVRVPWKDPTAHLNLSPHFPQSFWLPRILPGSRLHAGLILALASAVVVYLLISRSTFGYKIKIIGSSCSAALYGGIDVTKTTLVVAALSGGFSGLAGMNEIFGVYHHLLGGFTEIFGTSFTAIIIVWLAKNNILGAVLVSIFFGILFNGAEAMQRAAGVPAPVGIFFIGLVIMMILSFEKIMERWR